VEYDGFFSLANSITRDHNYKLKKQYFSVDAREFDFSNHVVDCWNCSRYHIVNASSLYCFKRHLSRLPVSIVHWWYLLNGLHSISASCLRCHFVCFSLELVLVSHDLRVLAHVLTMHLRHLYTGHLLLCANKTFGMTTDWCHRRLVEHWCHNRNMLCLCCAAGRCKTLDTASSPPDTDWTRFQQSLYLERLGCGRPHSVPSQRHIHHSSSAVSRNMAVRSFWTGLRGRYHV